MKKKYQSSQNRRAVRWRVRRCVPVFNKISSKQLAGREQKRRWYRERFR